MWRKDLMSITNNAMSLNCSSNKCKYKYRKHVDVGTDEALVLSSPVFVCPHNTSLRSTAALLAFTSACALISPAKLKLTWIYRWYIRCQLVKQEEAVTDFKQWAEKMPMVNNRLYKMQIDEPKISNRSMNRFCSALTEKNTLILSCSGNTLQALPITNYLSLNIPLQTHPPYNPHKFQAETFKDYNFNNMIKKGTCRRCTASAIGY